MRYSSENRISIDMITDTGRSLCRGAHGTQSDIQSIGYDRLCGLAALFRKEARDSYHAIELALDEIRVSAYSQGFQDGWDGRKNKITTWFGEYKLGYEDGRAASRHIAWRESGVTDVWAR